ncbi:MAG: 2-methylcitrate synthase/citrate synthase II [Candidatus Marinamargulisbacteria bacterium]|jgi:2-methylcitrate synthase/citrate synthase II
MSDTVVVSKGLIGVIADESRVSKVNVEESQLYYRGYNINDLVEKSSFVEVAYLLLNEDLPTPNQLTEFVEAERSLRDLPDELYAILADLPPQSHPMDVLRLGVNYLGLIDDENILGDTSHESNLRKARLLFSKAPTILANGYRLMNGLGAVKPDPGLSYTENFLSMMLGRQIEDPLQVKVFDASLILYAEHGFNASTFSARITASTLSDYYSAISSAIGTLKGPLHGGANEHVMTLLQEAGTKENAVPYIRQKLANKEKIMGFGHRLYRSGDSRVRTIKELGLELADQVGVHKWHEIAQAMEDFMISEKKIYPNLDFPSAIAYYLLGIPIPLYTPIFVASRLTGWTAHILEQHDDNRLIRPGCQYVGHEKRPVPLLSERG